MLVKQLNRFRLDESKSIRKCSNMIWREKDHDADLWKKQNG